MKRLPDFRFTYVIRTFYFSGDLQQYIFIVGTVKGV
jgi:hypothetical protein